MKINNILKCGVFILICEAAGIIGSFFTMQSVKTWYVTLNKPLLSPPNWIFGPVWTTLYALMGIAAYLIWQKGIRKEGVQKALSVFGAQLLLNVLWSVIFFGLHNPHGAFAIILALWASIIWTMVEFSKHSKTAAALLFPYILWVSFAGYLNYMFVVLN